MYVSYVLVVAELITACVATFILSGAFGKPLAVRYRGFSCDPFISTIQ